MRCCFPAANETSLGFVIGPHQVVRTASAALILPLSHAAFAQTESGRSVQNGISRSIPRPKGRRRAAIFDRLKLPSSGKSRSARPNRISPSGSICVTSHVPIRLACKVLIQHGEAEAEREEARRLLVILDARRPAREQRDDSDEPEVRP